MRGKLLWRLCAMLLWFTVSGVARAERVDVELVLAVDISMSMDWEELRLQRQGYVAALRDPSIHALIARGATKKIAVTYFEWAGTGIQRVIAPWTLIDGPDAANALADRIDQAPVTRERMTSISAALDFAGRLFAESPFKGIRRVVDVSGDGPNNAGRPVTVSRDALVNIGVAINGLPIILKMAGGWFDLKTLDLYYTDCVIGGSAAFTISIKSLEEFLPAIRRKLILEIAGVEPVARWHRVQASTEAPRVDCMIGEQLWRRYMDGRNPF
jgi:hypothetical protein